jgi:hypothetical protein
LVEDEPVVGGLGGFLYLEHGLFLVDLSDFLLNLQLLLHFRFGLRLLELLDDFGKNCLGIGVVAFLVQ